jgi:hypothetical protein
MFELGHAGSVNKEIPAKSFIVVEDLECNSALFFKLKAALLDPRHIDADPDADPDSTYRTDEDPDSTYHPDADPDPETSFQVKAQNLEKVLK